MPFKFPALFGICLSAFALSAFAQNTSNPAVKYQTCLNQAREEEKAGLVQCAGLRTEAAVSECTARYSVGEAKIAYCKLKSGIVLSLQPNNLEESKAAAEKQAAHERSLGVNGDDINKLVEGDFGAARTEVTGFEDTKGKKVVMPPSRPKQLDTNTDKRDVSENTPAKPGNANPSKTGNSRESSNPESTASSSNEASSAQAQVNADLARCESAQSAATSCCNNPLSCASSSDQSNIRRLGSYANSGDTQGLAAACRAMEGSSDSGGDINTSLGAICTNNHYACTNTCSSLANKYQSLMSANENSEAYSIYSSAVSALRSRSSQCGQLSARADALSRQGLSTASNSAYGNYCQQLASASPAAANSPTTANSNSGFIANDMYGCTANPNSPACVNCSKNPNSTACLNSKIAADARGEAGFRAKTDSSATVGGLNVKDLSGESYDGQIQTASGDMRTITYPNVPNNSGASVLGSQGGSQAQLDGRTRGAIPQSTRTYSTDVDQGYRSGGYSQPVSDNNTFPMHYGPRPAAAPAKDETSGYQGMDLKQFLPGGSRDPGRRLAGAADQSQINAKEENIWRRISNKMYEKCKLGILWRCN